jgi:MoxR-like ATPase
LQALFDRFLLRCHVQSLPRNAIPNLLAAGWAIERNGQNALDRRDAPTASDLRELARQCYEVNLGDVTTAYADAVGKVRDLGVALTDRRAVRVLKLLAASAVLCGRSSANTSDLWVLRYLWDREEQIAPLTALVAGLLEAAPAKDAHALAARPEHVDGESLARQLDEIAAHLTQKPASLVDLTRLREQVSGVADRAAWLIDAASRNHVLARTAELLERIG